MVHSCRLGGALESKVDAGGEAGGIVLKLNDTWRTKEETKEGYQWLALKPGRHVVKVTGDLSTLDFPPTVPPARPVSQPVVFEVLASAPAAAPSPKAPAPGGGWVQSDDKLVSLRFSAEDAEISEDMPIVLVAEVRNDSDKPLAVLMPFCGLPDQLLKENGQIEIQGPKGPVRYQQNNAELAIALAGVPATYYVLDPGKAYTGRFEVSPRYCPGILWEGEYKIAYTYVSAPKSPSAVKPFTKYDPALTRLTEKNAVDTWVGSIKGKVLAVKRVADPVALAAGAFKELLPGSTLTLENALKSQDRIVALCEATGPAVIKDKDETGMATWAIQTFKVKDRLDGAAEAGQEVLVGYSVCGPRPWLPGQSERQVQKGEQVIWVAVHTVRFPAANPNDYNADWTGLKVLPGTLKNRHIVATAVARAAAAAAATGSAAPGAKPDKTALAAQVNELAAQLGAKDAKQRDEAEKKLAGLAGTADLGDLLIKHLADPDADLEKRIARILETPRWGEADLGLRVALRPEKLQWKAGETPLFIATIRNDNDRKSAFKGRYDGWVIQVDQWSYSWNGDWDKRSYDLPPGSENNDLYIEVGERWAVEVGNRWLVQAGPDYPDWLTRSLAPGWHVIRVTPICRPVQERASLPDARPVSRAVAFEILPGERPARPAPVPLPGEAREKMYRLLAEADKKLRQGLQDLAKTFPQVGTADDQPLDGVVTEWPPRLEGLLSVWFHRHPLGKTPPAPDPDDWSLMAWLEPAVIPVTRMKVGDVCPNLYLHGAVGASTTDPKLQAALQKLLDEALAPLMALDREVGGKKPAAAEPPAGKPADAKPAAPADTKPAGKPAAPPPKAAAPPAAKADDKAAALAAGLPAAQPPKDEALKNLCAEADVIAVVELNNVGLEGRPKLCYMGDRVLKGPITTSLGGWLDETAPYDKLPMPPSGGKSKWVVFLKMNAAGPPVPSMEGITKVGGDKYYEILRPSSQIVLQPAAKEGWYCQDSSELDQEVIRNTPLPAEWSKPGDGIEIGLRLRLSKVGPDEDVVVEVCLRNATKEPKAIVQLRLSRFDVYPGLTFTAEDDGGRQWTLAQPPAFVRRKDAPDLSTVPMFVPVGLPPDGAYPRTLAPGEVYIHPVYMSKWPARDGPDKGKPVFDHAGRYTIRCQLDLEVADGIKGVRLESPPVTVTVAQAAGGGAGKASAPAAAAPAPAPAASKPAAPGPKLAADPKAALAAKVEALIAQLGDKDAAKRDAAEKALIEIDDPAEAALEAAIHDPDPERALRAGRALVAVRSHWGKPVKGLEVGIEPDKTYLVGKWMPVKWTIRNSGDKDVAIMWSEQNYSPVFLEVGREGEKPAVKWPAERAEIAQPPPPPERRVLKPGWGVTSTVNLAALFGGKVTAGTYTVAGLYAPQEVWKNFKDRLGPDLARQLADTVQDRVDSRTVSVTVVPTPPLVVAVCEALEDVLFVGLDGQRQEIVQRFKVLEILYPTDDPDVVAKEARVHYHLEESRLRGNLEGWPLGEGPIRKGAKVIWTALVKSAPKDDPADWEGERYVPDTPRNRLKAIPFDPTKPPPPAVPPPPLTERLKAVIESGRTGEIPYLNFSFGMKESLSEDEIEAAAAYVRDHPDSSSYLLLMALRQQANGAYWSVPDDIKARILCDALSRLAFLVDFGPVGPSDIYSSQATRAIVVLGKAAVPYLREELKDMRPAPLNPGEDAAKPGGYRRADLAYYCLMQIRGTKPTFPADLKQRDKLIADLEKELGANEKPAAPQPKAAAPAAPADTPKARMVLVEDVKAAAKAPAAAKAAEPPWGDSVKGVQMRLQVEKVVCESGREVLPILHLECRNTGKETWWLPEAGQELRLVVERQRDLLRAGGCPADYSHSPRSGQDGAAAGYPAVALALYGGRHGTEDLPPGKHTFHIRCGGRMDVADGAARTPDQLIEVASNLVEIEIPPPAAPAAKAAEPAWGEKVKGLQVSIEPLAHQYFLGQPMPVKWTIRNTTDKNVAIAGHDFFFRSVFFEIGKKGGEKSVREIEDLSVPPPIARTRPIVIVLRPGDSWSRTCDLALCAEPIDRPGVYTVAAVYRPSPWPNVFCDRVDSKTIEIEIKPADAKPAALTPEMLRERYALLAGDVQVQARVEKREWKAADKPVILLYVANHSGGPIKYDPAPEIVRAGGRRPVVRHPVYLAGHRQGPGRTGERPGVGQAHLGYA